MVKVAGITGYPLSHTLSPVMHNAVYRKYKMNWEYRVFETKPEHLEAFIKKTRAENIMGINVTVPHKQSVMPMLDGIDRAAALIGAVNTVVNRRGVLHGYNTDYLGFIESLKKARIKVRGKTVVLLGAGGAAHAIAYAISTLKPAKFFILNIDIPMIERMIKKLGLKNAAYGGISASKANDAAIASADLVINATSVGQHDNKVPYRIKNLKKGAVVYDIIYNPAKTGFLRLAGKKGARVMNGLDMLIFQGMHSFRLWTGRKSDYTAVTGALEKFLKKMG